MTARTGADSDRLFLVAAALMAASAIAWYWTGQPSWSLTVGALILAALAWSRRGAAQKRDISVSAPRHAESESER